LLDYPAGFYVGKTSTGTVTLEDTADPGGVLVNLAVSFTAGSTGKVTVPATVTVPGGQTSVTYSVTGIATGQGGRITAVRSGSSATPVSNNWYFTVYP
jgi:hypothetical protein